MLIRPIVYLISEGRLTASNFFDAAEGVCETARIAAGSGVTMVQIREKQLPARLVFDLTRLIAESVRGTATKVIVNDRADIAAAAGADGVHLTTASIRPRDVRSVFPGLIVGASTHSAAEIAAAREGKADFAVFGPIFPSPGKCSAVGIDELARVCREFDPFPIVGLGGVNGANCRQVLEVAAGFAAIRFLNDTDELKGLRL